MKIGSPTAVNSPRNYAFLDLVFSRFGSAMAGEAYDEALGQMQGIASETDFDLFLWSLARKLKVDTEELLRQLGEAWLRECEEREQALAEGKTGMLQALDWILSDSALLQSAPVLGMAGFRAVVMSRGPNALRACCVGPRRCCSFLEGVARALGQASGESVRYLRHPQSAVMVEILFKTFEQPVELGS